MRRIAATHGHAIRVIARLRARAGEDHVAEPGQAGQRLGACAERAAEAKQLGEAARHQRGVGAGAEPAAGDDAGGDGEHVLGGAADLDAAHVGGMIGPQRRRAERARQRHRHCLVAGGERDRGRQAARHVGGKARAGEDRRLRGRRAFGNHLGHEPVRAALDALGAGDDRRALAQRRRDRGGGRAQVLRRNRQQDDVVAPDVGPHRRDANVLVQPHAG